jgi:superfamily II DNA or RNA helicase
MFKKTKKTKVIVLHVHNTSTFIEGSKELSREQRSELREVLGFEDEASVFRARNIPGHDGIISTLCFGYGKRPCKCYLKKNGMHFPSGLVGRVVRFFKNQKVDFRVKDHRQKVDLVHKYTLSSACESRDYQELASSKAIEQGRGILVAATGAGKTFMSSKIMADLGAYPFVFFVPSQDLLKQAKNEFEKFIDGATVGVVGGGECTLNDITVMTLQTAARAICPEKYDKRNKDGSRSKRNENATEDDEGSSDDNSDLSEKYELIRNHLKSTKAFIIDECQHASSETVQMLADFMEQAYYRWGVSATPWRDKGDDLLIDSCFGKPVCDINASYLIDKGYLIKPTIYFVPITNMDGLEFDSYHDAYQEGIVANEYRNNAIAKIAKKLVDDGRTVLVLVKNIEHGETLESIIDGSLFLNGSHSGKVRDEHLEKMRNHEAPVTIASTIFDEGIDVRPLDAVILAGGGKSQTRALQRVGRAIRPYSNESYTKKDAVIVDFYDDMKWMRKHSRKRRRIYETEPLFEIKDLKI